MTERLYFAYGSNMDEAQMAFRCPNSVRLGTGRLDGFRFLINERGVASIEDRKGSIVHGLLWNISESDGKHLDRYEGVKTGLYFKRTVPVTAQDNRFVEALTYVASSNKSGTPRTGYLEKIIHSAVNLGFPPPYVEELNSWSFSDATDVQST